MLRLCSMFSQVLYCLDMKAVAFRFCGCRVSAENHKQSLEKQGSDSFEDSALGSGELGMEHSEHHTPSSFNSNLSALSSQMEEGLHLGSHDDSPFHHHLPDGLDDKVGFFFLSQIQDYCLTIEIKYLAKHVPHDGRQ